MPRTAAPWKAVALPSEHGGWSLTAEPVVLGLAVAWSGGGLALGLAAMLTFVARTPLKLFLVDRWRGRWLPRTRLAAMVAAAEIVVVVALVVGTTVAAGGDFWLPFAAAAPLVAVELWFDMRSRSRRLIPELAGAIGIGAVATAIALAGDLPTRAAWGLWAVLAARSVSAIPYVRTQIQRAHDRPAALWHSDVAQAIAVAGAAVAWFADVAAGAGVIAVGVFASLNVVAVRVPPRPAVVIGIQQTVVGLVVIAATAIAVA